MSEVTEYVGVILEDGLGRIALQLREPDRTLNPDRWSVFGGHLKTGEAPIRGAVREIEEELSVMLGEEKLNYMGRFEREEHAYHIFHFTAGDELEGAELKEGLAWRWCSPKEIMGGVIEGKKVVDYHVRFLERFFEGGKGK